jgi:hypothetical protein
MECTKHAQMQTLLMSTSMRRPHIGTIWEKSTDAKILLQQKTLPFHDQLHYYITFIRRTGMCSQSCKLTSALHIRTTKKSYNSTNNCEVRQDWGATHLCSTNVVVQHLFVKNVSRQCTIFQALNKLRQVFSP